MENNIQQLLIGAINDALKALKLAQSFKEDLCLDLPKDSRFGDFSTNIALRLAKLVNRPASELGEEIALAIKKRLEKSPANLYVKEVKAQGAGFINFYLAEEYFLRQLRDIITKGPAALKMNLGRARPVLLEFVSANPTGSLSVAHARQAAVGDSLANILDFLGFKVRREYYLNDEGNQINLLGKSVELRLKELNGEKINFAENYYQGDYIYEIAKRAQSLRPKAQNLGDFAADYILDSIKQELLDFDTRFDSWYSQKALTKSGKIKRALAWLKKKGYLYEHQGALWFKSTALGDDKDRVVIKSDGSYTYLAPDIAYHEDKYKRGFKWLINLWGPDHHGYINRLKAAARAFGHQPASLTIIIVQLATIFRDAKAVQMSTRKGQYITLREVLDEVGLDAARFFFVMRRTASHLDFDLDVAKKQTPENPVYYVQYAHARICSILDNSPLKINKGLNLALLKEKEELSLIKKSLQLPYILNICLSTLDPYMLTVYLQELAEAFHKFYDLYRVLGQADELTKARLALIEASRTVIAQGLELLGVSRPRKM